MRYKATMETAKKSGSAKEKPADPAPVADRQEKSPKPSKEVGGREGPDPTRFGDWEKNGRCIDF